MKRNFFSPRVAMIRRNRPVPTPSPSRSMSGKKRSRYSLATALDPTSKTSARSMPHQKGARHKGPRRPDFHLPYVDSEACHVARRCRRIAWLPGASLIPSVAPRDRWLLDLPAGRTLVSGRLFLLYRSAGNDERHRTSIRRVCDENQVCSVMNAASVGECGYWRQARKAA
jgi:hypothetical protein